MKQTDHQIGIFMPPSFKALIKTVDGQKILAPHSQITGTRPAPTTAPLLAPSTLRQTQQGQQSIDFATDPGQEPAVIIPSERVGGSLYYPIRQIWIQQD